MILENMKNITLITTISMLHNFALGFWAKIQRADTGVMILLIAQGQLWQAGNAGFQTEFFNKTLVKDRPIH